MEAKRLRLALGKETPTRGWRIPYPWVTRARDRVVDGPVERVGHRPHQRRRRRRGKDGVRVQGDDEADGPQRRQLAHRHRERPFVAAQHQMVELAELPPLALPTHPHPLAGVPLPGAVQEVEEVPPPIAVASLEGLHARHGCGDDLRVGLPMFGGRVGEVAEHHELEMRPAVGEELRLQMFQGALHRGHAPEEGGDHHRGLHLPGNTGLLDEVELGEPPGGEELRDQQLEHLDRELLRRKQRQQHHQPATAGVPPDRPARRGAPGLRWRPPSSPHPAHGRVTGAPRGGAGLLGGVGSRCPAPGPDGRRRPGTSPRDASRCRPGPRRRGRWPAGPPRAPRSACAGPASPPHGGNDRVSRRSSAGRPPPGRRGARPPAGSGSRRSRSSPAPPPSGGW